MAKAELVRALDFILNRCDDSEIDAVAAAVVRRRRDLAYYGSLNIPDPRKMAESISAGMNVGAGLDGLRDSIRAMAASIIRNEAPGITDEQIAVLTSAWIPSPQSDAGGDGGSGLPGPMLSSMVGQFVAYSRGDMGEHEEKELRRAMGDWSKRYWNAFPDVVRLLIKDYLKGEISEGEFSMKLGTALAMKAG